MCVPGPSHQSLFYSICMVGRTQRQNNEYIAEFKDSTYPDAQLEGGTHVLGVLALS